MIDEQDKGKSNKEAWKDNELETRKSIMIYKNGDAYAELLVEQIGQTRHISEDMEAGISQGFYEPDKDHTHIWRWQPWRDEPTYIGTYPRCPEAIENALLHEGILAFRVHEQDIVLVWPNQHHKDLNWTNQAEVNDIED